MTPDALLLPASFAHGQALRDRIDSVLAVAEPLLRVDRSTGERAYIRRQHGDLLFVTKDPFDTMFHPMNSELQGRPRYRWDKPREDGIRFGYL